MTQQIRKMPTPGGIGAGETATVTLPLGLTYHQLMIKMNVKTGGNDIDVPVNNWDTYLGKIRLYVNGENTFTMEAKDLVNWNKHNRQQMVAGMLPIFLSRPWSQTAGGQDETAYKTAAGVSTFTIEIDQKPGITVNKLEVYARQSPGVLANGSVMGWGTHLRVQRFSKQMGLTGLAEISDIPKRGYHLMGLQIDTDKIGRSEVVINSNTIVEMDPVIREACHLYDKRDKVAGNTFIDFDSAGRIDEIMPMSVQDARFNFDFTEAGNYFLYTFALYPS